MTAVFFFVCVAYSLLKLKSTKRFPVLVRNDTENNHLECGNVLSHHLDPGFFFQFCHFFFWLGVAMGDICLSATLLKLSYVKRRNTLSWGLSYTCIVTSWSQRRRPKHGGPADRWGSTCHAYGRKFAIKIQCEWDEKYVNLKMKT